MQTIIQTNQLGKTYQTEYVQVKAVDAIDLTINKGDFVAITGPSGCGKSTLLSLLGLLEKPTTGQCLIGGNDIGALNRGQRAQFRNRHIGFVFQAFNLLSHLTVIENVMLPLAYRRGSKSKPVAEKAMQILDMVRLSDRARHYPGQLSGGQMQRASIARAVICDPNIILADEPTGNLDSEHGEDVMSLFLQLHQAGHTLCVVTHDPGVASQAQRVIKMHDGRIAA